MKNFMEYKGYLGSVEYSNDDECLFGKVQGIRSLISYEGYTIKELKEDFYNAVDDYLETCQKENKNPEKAFKGSFNIRINENLHRDVFIYAENNGKSLNKVVSEALKKYIA